jgi:hypothetical protein
MARFGLADFTPGLQEGLIQNRGSRLLHEIGVACTCRVEDTFAGLQGDGQERRREPFCPRCRGDGWLYRSPQLLIGLVTSIRGQRNVLDAGIAMPGDMLLSPEFKDDTCGEGDRRPIGAYDKITATWPQPLDDGHVLVRGAATAYENQGLQTFLQKNQDRLWYEPAAAVWCEDSNGVVYNADADFVLGPGKIITWTGNQPTVGMRYTIKYEAYFEWIAFQPAQERRDRDNENLGQLVFLRRRHIALINESPLATAADHISIQSRVSC